MSVPCRLVGITTVALTAALLLVVQGRLFERDAQAASLGVEGNDSTEIKLMVMYPQPTDVAQFEADYDAHLLLLREKLAIPEGTQPYTVTRFLSPPDGSAPYYQLFTMTFASPEALQEARGTQGMQEVAADAARISSGGPPVVLVGTAR
ncbi:MAG: EthD family reductase [Bacteroidota bacterium]